MGAKHVCFSCRKAFNAPAGSIGPSKCPECGQSIVLLPHRFRPPKIRDDEKWKTVKFLFKHGFHYQHIVPLEPILSSENFQKYVQYPESLREAREFVKAYSGKARANKHNNPSD